MLNVTEKELDIVKDIIKKTIPNDIVWAFGSRITSSIKNHSDLDLVVVRDKGNSLSIFELRTLNELFSECPLPFRVDILDWSELDDSFKEIIKNKYEIIQ